jgi:hypothetical protein
MESNASMGHSPDSSQQVSLDILRPPGFAGEIASYLYHSAPRPHREPAVVGTLGLLAGINGRAYTVSNPKMGINLYLMLVMETAMGKEAMFRIVSLHNRACNDYAKSWSGVHIDTISIAQHFVEAGTAVSASGLRRRMHEDGAAFVNVVTELGQNIKEMAEATTESAAFQLKLLFLELFEKSGPDQVLGGVKYSKSDQNMHAVIGPGISIMGDTTPETFYSAMSTALAADGFMSRFTIVECPTHIRPPWNRNVPEASAALLLGLQWMIAAAAEAVRSGTRTHLECDAAAQELLDAFDKECDREINGTRDATVRASWSRSMAKAYRTAANLTVADHFGHRAWAHLNGSLLPPPPLEIQREHMEWAIELERRNAKLLTTRAKTGDIGTGDDTRRDKLATLIEEYLSQPLPEKWTRLQPLKSNSIVSYEWLQMRTQKLAAFKNHKTGATTALYQATRSLIESGWLMEVSKDKMVEHYNYHGRCYRVLSLPGYEPKVTAPPPWVVPDVT